MKSEEGASTNVEDVHVSERLLMSGSSVDEESSSPTQRGVSPSSVVYTVLLVDLVLYWTVVLCWYVS